MKLICDVHFILNRQKSNAKIFRKYWKEW